MNLSLKIQPSEWKKRDTCDLQIVIKAWEEREKGLWDNHWQKAGYKNWCAWRLDHLKKYGFWELMQEKGWEVIELLDPIKTAPKIQSGPYKGWKIYHPEGKRKSLPFFQIAAHPHAQNHERFRRIEKEICERTEERSGIGLYDPESEEMILIDGHHTFTAFALAAEDHKIPLAKALLYLKEIRPDQKNQFDRLKEGKIRIPEDDLNVS